jgi:hypothetical protein
MGIGYLRVPGGVGGSDGMNLWNVGIKARTGVAGARGMLSSPASTPENAMGAISARAGACPRTGSNRARWSDSGGKEIFTMYRVNDVARVGQAVPGSGR